MRVGTAARSNVPSVPNAIQRTLFHLKSKTRRVCPIDIEWWIMALAWRSWPVVHHSIKRSIGNMLSLVMGNGRAHARFCLPARLFSNAHFAHARRKWNGHMPSLPMPQFPCPACPRAQTGKAKNHFLFNFGQCLVNLGQFLVNFWSIFGQFLVNLGQFRSI